MGLRTRLLLTALLSLPVGHVAGQSAPSTLRLINGRWFDGAQFRSRSFYVTNGLLTSQRPAQVDTIIDLAGGYVIPAAGDAHQHRFAQAKGLEEETEQFLGDGVFYVMVQDAIVAPSAEVVARVNRPDGVDVVYTRGPLVGGTHGLIDFYERAGAEGWLGEPLSRAELDGRALFVMDRVEDLKSKWDAVLAANPDFVKLILAFSEDRARRLDPAFVRDSSTSWARAGVNPELVPAIVERAHAAGRRVSAHVETAADFATAVNAGVDLVAHLPGWHLGPTARFADTSLSHWIISEDIAALAARRRVTVITTLLPKPFFDNARLGTRFREVQRENLRRLARHGVPIALGADGEGTSLAELEVVRSLGVFDNRSLLRMLVETTPQAIFPARRIGRLEEGYEASLVVLARDPLLDLDHLRERRLRMKQGRLLP